MTAAQEFKPEYLQSVGFSWSEKHQRWQVRASKGVLLAVLVMSKGKAGGVVLRYEGAIVPTKEGTLSFYRRIDRRGSWG